MKCIVIGSSILWIALLSDILGGAQTQHAANASSQDPRLIDSIQGPALFKAYCASCHGVDAKGSGPMANSLKVAPADLTRISMRSGGTFPLARVSRIISGEEQMPSGHGTSDMPVWGPIFSRVEADRDLGRVRLDNLARYLKQIQKP
jgi:mono/diheme cytochrome c family protein